MLTLLVGAGLGFLAGVAKRTTPMIYLDVKFVPATNGVVEQIETYYLTGGTKVRHGQQKEWLRDTNFVRETTTYYDDGQKGAVSSTSTNYHPSH